MNRDGEPAISYVTTQGCEAFTILVHVAEPLLPAEGTITANGEPVAFTGRRSEVEVEVDQVVEVIAQVRAMDGAVHIARWKFDTTAPEDCHVVEAMVAVPVDRPRPFELPATGAGLGGLVALVALGVILLVVGASLRRMGTERRLCAACAQEPPGDVRPPRMC